MTKEIALTQGQVALVSDEDYEFLNQWKWYALKRPSYSGTEQRYYAVRNESIGNGKRTHIHMHRVVLERMGHDLNGKFADHINHEQTLNNTRDNLRPATRSESQSHRGMHRNNNSGYAGVDEHKQTGKWQVRINLNGKRKYLGLYHCKHEAALVYNNAAIEYHGKFAKIDVNIIACDVETRQYLCEM